MAVLQSVGRSAEMETLLEPARLPLISVENEFDARSKTAFPVEDGIPLESNWHRIEMNVLIDSVHAWWHDRRDYFTGGNMFIYFSAEQARNRDYRGPDFFVVKGVDGTLSREAWFVWREAGRYPDVIVELASPFHRCDRPGVQKTVIRTDVSDAGIFLL